MSEHQAATETQARVSDLELSGEQMRRMVDEAMKHIVAHIESLPRQPSSDVEGAAELARSLMEPLPRKGQPYEELLKLLFERVIPKSFNAPAPGYLAYIPGGGLLHSAVAELIANAVNRFTGIWLPAPALSQLEANVVRWFCEIVGYPPEARGYLSTGGSLANFSALVTARRERLPEDFLDGALYTSDQAHHSVQKAAMLAGFPDDSVRVIPSDDRFRIRLDLLEERIADDRRAGLTPFVIVANAGTTNTGAVDDLQALAGLAEREDLWLHADAAYGGFFMLTERGRRAMAGLERADSIVLDPHKGLFLPYGTGCLLVRDGDALQRAHTVAADYLPTMQHDPDFVDFSEISPELSRDYRGLRVWLPLKMHGIEPFGRNLDEKLDLTLWATEELRKIDGIEIVAEPQLTVVAFRLVRPDLGPDGLNELNRRVIDAVNARKRVFLSGTTLRGRFVLRICVVSFRTHLERMRQCLEDIRAAVAELEAQ